MDILYQIVISNWALKKLNHLPSICLLLARKRLICLKHAQCSLTHFNYVLFQFRAIEEFPFPSTILLPTRDYHSQPQPLPLSEPGAAASTAVNGLELGNLSLYNQCCRVYNPGTKCIFHQQSASMHANKMWLPLELTRPVQLKSMNSGGSLPESKSWFHLLPTAWS